MWIILGTVVWKFLLTWLAVFGGLFVWGIIQTLMIGMENMEDTLIDFLLTLWFIIGGIGIAIAILALYIMTIIEIWN